MSGSGRRLGKRQSLSAKAVSRLRRDLCRPAAEAWRAVDDTKVGEIYTFECRLACAALGGRQRRAWEESGIPERGMEKGAVRRVCARWRRVYNGIASTERVGIGQGGDVVLFFASCKKRVVDDWDEGQWVLLENLEVWRVSEGFWGIRGARSSQVVGWPPRC